MSRSGYSDDFCDEYHLYNLYRATVERSMRGKRGQKALRDLVDALDAMPEKKLAPNSFQAERGVCALGALAQTRGVDMSDLNPDEDEWDDYGYASVDLDETGRRLDISRSMAAEVMYMNDEGICHTETDEERWKRMRDWAARNLKESRHEA